MSTEHRPGAEPEPGRSKEKPVAPPRRRCGPCAKGCGIFPNVAVAGLCYVAWSSVLTVPILFPLSGFMVLEYGMAEAREDAGYFAGFLASCFMIGRTLTAAPWGVVADKHGLVPVLAACTVMSAICTVAVGFVDNYMAAVVLRIANGLVNPIIALVKGLLPDMVSHRDQHRAMSVVTAQWQFGLIMGPGLSGLLAYPCGNDWGSPAADEDMEGFLCSRPFLLPLAVCGALQLTSLLPLWKLVRPRIEAARRAAQPAEEAAPALRPESTSPPLGGPPGGPAPSLRGLGKRRRRAKYSRLEEGERPVAGGDSCAEGQPTETEGYASDSTDEPEPSVDGEALSPCDSQGASGAAPPEEEKVVAPSPVPTKASGPNGMGAMLRDRHFCLLLFIYCYISFVGTSVHELAALFTMAPSSLGGLGGESSHIGEVFSSVGAICLLFQLTMGPMVVRKLGLIRALRMGILGCAASSAAIPYIPQLLPESLGFSREAWLLGLTFALSVKSCMDYLCFSSVFVLVNNSVPTHCRGRANGLAMTVASCFKALGPAVCGAGFAWSVGLPAHVHLVDAHLVFVLVGLLTVLCDCVCASRIPDWAIDPYDAQPGRARKVVDATHQTA